MNNILITGATGNVGREVIKNLLRINKTDKIIAGVRKMNNQFGAMVESRYFDFEVPATFKPALEKCDILFLLRPPQLADVKRYFDPLINAAKDCAVKHIVFISVQGAQNSPMIPHHKIEKLIVKSSIPYTFLRPAYFMQNFTTILRKDIVDDRLIFLPAGNVKFTITDVADVGLVSSIVLTSSFKHINKSYELTNHEKLSFREMAEKISAVLGVQISYRPPDLVSFFKKKRKEKMAISFILVMIMLHYFPRFSKAPDTSDCIERLTGNLPGTFNDFLKKNKHLLKPATQAS